MNNAQRARRMPRTRKSKNTCMAQICSSSASRSSCSLLKRFSASSFSWVSFSVERKIYLMGQCHEIMAALPLPSHGSVALCWTKRYLMGQCHELKDSLPSPSNGSASLLNGNIDKGLVSRVMALWLSCSCWGAYMPLRSHGSAKKGQRPEMNLDNEYLKCQCHEFWGFFLFCPVVRYWTEFR